MKTKLLILLLAVCGMANAQNWLWATSAGAGSSTTEGKNICTDSYGNSYVTGSFINKTIFGTDTFNSSGPYDVFLTKYNANGNVLWAKKSGSIGMDYGNGVCIDNAGYVYAVGNFDGSEIFFDSDTIYCNGGSDIFLVKYDSNGNVIWAKGFGGNDVEYGYDVCCDATGNVFLTGFFNSTSIKFGTTTLTNTHAGSSDIFIAKCDSSGNPIWAVKGGGNTYDLGNSISTDIFGNVFVTGSFDSPTLTFDTTVLYNNNNNYDIFIIKYDPAGDLLWAKRTGGNHYTIDKSNSICTDLFGNAYITGIFESDTIIFDSDTLINSSNNTGDVFLVKYDSNGNVLWAKNAAGTGYERGSDVCTDSNGYVYLTGCFNNSNVNFDSITLTNYGGNDIFLVKYSSNGSAVYAKNAIGNGGDESKGVCIDANGDVLITGYFESFTITFSNYTIPRKGSKDMFIAKIVQNLTNIDNVIVNNDILIYPNPTNNKIIISTTLKSQIEIINIEGQIIKKIKNADTRTTIDLENLSSGVYLIKAITDNGINVKKFVKQ